MVGKKAAPLLGLIAAAAACAGCFVLLALSNDNPSVMLMSRSSPALLTALAQQPAKNGNSNLAVRKIIKGSLDSDEKDEEGKLYAHALSRAGLKLDPAAKKVIEMSLAKARNRPSSLSIDPKLQKQVKVAQSIQTNKMPAITKHSEHRQMSDRLRLAEAILRGTKADDKVHSKKVVDSGKTVKSSMKAVLDNQAHSTLKQMEHNALHPQSKTMKALSTPVATSMMHELNARDASMLKSVEHRGLSQQDLLTREWTDNGGVDDRTWAAVASQQSELHSEQELKAWYSRKQSDPKSALNPGAHKAFPKFQQKRRPMPQLDLTVGQGHDGTRLAVFNGPQQSRIALEAQLRGELDNSAQSLQQERLMREQLGSSRARVHDAKRYQAHSMISNDRIAMEARLRGQLEGEVHNKEEQMFHKSLIKEHFTR